MKFLIDECLHTSLVEVAHGRGHEASHVNWLGLSGETDWDLMPKIIDENFTFVTNNAADFRRLYADRELHAGLVIIIPQVRPETQRQIFDALCDELAGGDDPINEAIEIRLEDGAAVFERYALPGEPPA